MVTNLLKIEKSPSEIIENYSTNLPCDPSVHDI